MRILFISLMNGFKWGGSEELWVKVALYSLQKNDAVAVSTKFWSGNQHSKLDQVNLRGGVLHKWNTLPSPTFFQRVLLKLGIRRKRETNYNWQELQAFAPETICISMGSTFDLVYHQDLLQMIQSNHYSYSLICQLNFENLPLNEEVRRKAQTVFKGAKNIFFVSERNRKVAERNLAIRLTNAFIVSNPINLDNLTVIPFPKNDCIQLACVARLDTKFKGQDILLEILAGSEWNDRNWNLNLYGEGPDRNYLTELIDYFGLTGRVFFHGHVGDIRNIWTRNQVLLMPSYAEGTPIALVEAMFCGRPSVVTDVGGNAELVDEGVSGFIADAYGIGPFRKALERAWSQRHLFEQLGSNANKSVTQKVNLESYVEIYRRISS